MYRLLIILSLSSTFFACQNNTEGRTFYVDSLTGNDNNNGLSPKKAWASLEIVNQQKFLPGDKLLFKSGTSYTGTMELHGSGSKNNIIQVSNYGTGEKPIIQGGGQKQYTVLLKNIEYYQLSNLEITNTGDKREAGRTGVLIQAYDFGDIHHIILNNLEVHHVNGSLVKSEGGGSAILWQNEGDSIPSCFVGLLIENCYIHDCERNGIISNGNAARDRWYPSKKVVIRNNLLERIPGDGIVPIGCDSALIEYNTMREGTDILSHEEAAAGIWPWSCDYTVIQFNEVSGHCSKWDGQGFDSDYNCNGTIIRFNLSHNNYGGFLLVCNDGNSLGHPFNSGTTNSVIEYNLSINDGIRPYPTKREGWFSPVFHITGPVENSLIANNIIVLPKRDNQNIPSEMIHMANWGNAWPKNTTIQNNHFFQSPDAYSTLEKAQNTQINNNKVYSCLNTHAEIIKFVDSLACNSSGYQKEGYGKLKDFLEKKNSF